MKNLVKNLTILLLLSFQFLYSQQLKYKDAKMVSESEIYIDETSNVRYSNLIKMKFNKNLLRLQEKQVKVGLDNIIDEEAKIYLVNLNKKYGCFEITKLVPEANWGDTLVVNRRTGELINIPEWSQVIKIRFENFVPIDSIINDLSKQSFIEYAEEPIQGYTMIEPNDEMYIKNNWAFDKIMAEKAWNITKGDSSITIGIHDLFGNSTSHEIHDDLKGKVKSHYNKFGNHGTCVAGVAGANTDNEIGVASLGWNLKLRFYRQSYCTSEIMRAINDKVDVLNFSWVITVDIPSFRDAVKTALANGIVCVAAAGNNQKERPQILYPAAYNFGDLGQVIAVSATEIKNGDEKFIDGWNYSPGDNPFVDPTSAFIDIAAPGRDITILNENGSSGYSNACGTSLSTPFVSALAGLLLSKDSTLTPIEIYNIITSTSDKIGQYNYDANGWNQYLGYGRINAYKALDLITQSVNINKNNNSKVVSNFKLEQNYPNPFNPSTSIRYSVPERTTVSLTVYDVLGNLIEVLLDEEQLAGSYEVVFNASEHGKKYSSGVYIFKLNAGRFVNIKKGLLLK